MTQNFAPHDCQRKANVGFHRHRAEPGSPLARARMAAHDAFDPLWKEGHMTRSEAYAWLAEKLGIRKSDCHMVNFDQATCQQVYNLCMQRYFQEHM